MTPTDNPKSTPTAPSTGTPASTATGPALGPDLGTEKRRAAAVAKVSPTLWLQRIRLRSLWLLVGIGLTSLGIISLTAIPAWPVVGVAVAALALGLNNIAHRLSQPTCLSCGHNLHDAIRGEHGAICPQCGAISDRLA